LICAAFLGIYLRRNITVDRRKENCIFCSSITLREREFNLENVQKLSAYLKGLIDSKLNCAV
jgi:hypothetical protein